MQKTLIVSLLLSSVYFRVVNVKEKKIVFKILQMFNAWKNSAFQLSIELIFEILSYLMIAPSV